MEFWALLAGALGAGLLDITKRLGDAGVDLALEPLQTVVKTWLQKPFRKKESDERLVTSLLAAVEALGLSGDKDAVLTWVRQSSLDRLLAKHNSALRRQFALAVLTHCDAQAAAPAELLLALRWPRSDAERLGRLLSAMRQQLATNQDWQDLVAYFDRARQQEQLGAVLAALRQMLDAVVPLPDGAALLVQVAQPHFSAPELQSFQTRYVAGVRKFYQVHVLQGLSPEAGKAVDLPLTEMYFELGLLERRDFKEQLAEEAAQLTRDVLQRLEHEMERGRRRRMGEALGEQQHLVVLGKPGSGKTITLRFLALMLLEGESGAAHLGLDQSYLPILLRLGDFAQKLIGNPGLTLHQALADEFVRFCPGMEYTSRFLEQVLATGRVMVLLDGLDETGDFGSTLEQGRALRERIVCQIGEFVAQNCQKGKNRMVVSSRLEGYPEQGLAGFVEVELSPLLFPEEVEGFLLSWFTAYRKKRGGEEVSLEQAGQEAQDLVQELLPKIERSDGVTLLATNPLMLTILALIYEMGRNLPDQRVDLYRIVVKTMIDNWRLAQTQHASRLIERVQTQDVWRVMAELAFWVHEQIPGGTMPEPEWKNRISDLLVQAEVCDKQDAKQLAENFLDYARRENGLLTERSAGRVGFFHLTLEEYLAGWKIAHEKADERQRILTERWKDPYWEEVLLLVAGELQAGERDALKDFLVYLLAVEVGDALLAGRPALLAGRALVDLQNRKQSLQELVVPRLREAAWDWDTVRNRVRERAWVPLKTRVAAADVLDELGWAPEDLGSLVAIRDEEGRVLFKIGKYPVTNGEYRAFLESGQFAEERYWVGQLRFDARSQMDGDWGEEGLAWLRQAQQKKDFSPDGGVVYPRRWRDPQFGMPRLGAPVVGMTWWEANAYCRWRSEQLGWGLEGLRLPTEAEWLRAAGGDRPEGRYPWDEKGKETEAKEAILKRANAALAVGRTTVVWQYPLGATEGGVWDLAGNVWEWQANLSGDDRDRFALRGGSWNTIERYVRCALRGRYASVDFTGIYGFRLFSPDIFLDAED